MPIATLSAFIVYFVGVGVFDNLSGGEAEKVFIYRVHGGRRPRRRSVTAPATDQREEHQESRHGADRGGRRALAG